MTRALARPSPRSTHGAGPRGPKAFLFVAAKSTGGRTMGLRQARSQRALSESLRRDRQILLSAWTLPAWAASEARLGLKDQAELNQQLAQLLGRGVTLVETLEVVRSTVRAQAQDVVDRMREAVGSGASFSEACERTGVFDSVTIAVYRAAEKTGDLAGAAQQLATTAKRQLAVRGKAGTLMLYPAIVLTISILVSIGIIVGIVPKIGEALEGADITLPVFTKAIVAFGLFLRENALIALGVVGAGLVLMVIGRKRVGAALARFSRTVPVLKDVVLAQESARFFAVMAAMSRSGVPLSDGLGVAVEAIGIPSLRRELVDLRRRLMEGGQLRILIDRVKTLPLATRRLLIAAERSGDLESAFNSLAEDLSDEVDRKAERLLAVLEPLLIVIMFLLIGSLLMSIMIPLLTATQGAF
ncbi:MAG: type II secretion system F family protein [Phycisphaeraceae bacterium]|nr:type II secretion system F family protein [Phycisphaeraceae bacterium]